MKTWVSLVLILVGATVFVFGGAYLGVKWQTKQDEQTCSALHGERIKYVKSRALCLDSEGRILN